MKPKKEIELLNLVAAEERDAIGYADELGEKREVLLRYYNCEPFGDEVDGQSSFVSSDVQDTVEGMLPALVKLFTQNKRTAVFHANTAKQEEEAKQKTDIANHVFFQQNKGALLLYNWFKDAILQYCGMVKVVHEEREITTKERYSGIDEAEYLLLQQDDALEISEVEQDEDGTYEIEATRTEICKNVRYQLIPPEEQLIPRDARDFDTPRFIGHRSPVRRSVLLEMGFDEDIVMSLPAHDDDERGDSLKNERYKDINGDDRTSTTQKANDEIYLTECYIYFDDNDDGRSELYQVFKAGNKILQYEAWDQHPFACLTPIPMPHRAIGNCQADLAADIQRVNSVLVRNMLDNIYLNNWSRIAYNDNVDLDDLLVARAGGTVHVEGTEPVQNSLFTIPVQSQTANILAAKESIDVQRESRTGISRINQGLDPETLSETATAFQGLTNASNQRLDLTARLFAMTGVADLFRKTVDIISAHQDEEMQVMISGKELTVDPRSWKYNLSCTVNIGAGGGDKAEKVANLNYIVQLQQQLMAVQSPLADSKKMYNALAGVISEVGLKDVDRYFNDPEVPEDMAQAMVEILQAQVNQLQQQIQSNPLAEAETIKAQAKLIEAQSKGQNDMQQFLMKFNQEQDQFRQEMIAKFTEMELKYAKDVPGSAV